ncbi:MAG: CRISPR-associated endonuclease Cas2 [Haliscomenobacter sp.]|nr:CRISPR-associated endonuclease Cas2 [Haliscomenobacter sp.]MBK8652360.1 CRISPR-associated endonuclease Cas2 [Haliscomenobacter sp.]
MICWVIYDIENDKARNQVAKCCKQAGLYRVQLSVFLGELEPTRKDALHLQLEALINPDRDKVYLFPMSKQELQQTVLLGQAFDRKLVTGQVRALFL